MKMQFSLFNLVVGIVLMISAAYVVVEVMGLKPPEGFFIFLGIMTGFIFPPLKMVPIDNNRG